MIQTHIRYNSLPAKQLISDLIWVLQSRALLSTELPQFHGYLLQNIAFLVDDNELRMWIESMMRDPEKIKKFFNDDEQLILGKYFERLIGYFFTSYPQFEVVMMGKQIFDGKDTVGELDFVIKDKKRNKNFHLEVAVKYYMGFKNVGKHDLWIGPNGSDTLQKKVSKLQKQLELSQRIDVRVDEKIALILGYFFKHWKSSYWPYFANRTIEDVLWIYENEMEEFFERDAYYAIIPKSLWLSFFIEPKSELNKGFEIIELIQNQLALIGKGIMLAKIDDTTMTVLQKCIVAPMRWPRL